MQRGLQIERKAESFYSYCNDMGHLEVDFQSFEEQKLIRLFCQMQVHWDPTNDIKVRRDTCSWRDIFSAKPSTWFLFSVAPSRTWRSGAKRCFDVEMFDFSALPVMVSSRYFERGASILCLDSRGHKLWRE